MDAVAHYVHKNARGERAVVAVLFKKGKTNPALENLWKKLHLRVNDSAQLKSLDLQAILPKNHAYYSFMGALTTPPCSENVRWYVLKNPVSIGARQLSKFHKMYHGNNRPVNPLNGRIISE